jgi:NAD-dependent deacetylase
MSTPRFADFERILFFTGAGLSVESGIPTYRGKGGLWAEYDYEDYACQRAFVRAPEKVWDFHDKRREKVGACEPNDGHRIIAEVQREKSTTAIVTQNIDGLHQRAGGTDVVELHGSLWRVRCDAEGILRDDRTVPMSPRKCRCGAYWRPDIVWFEDPLREETLERAQELLVRCDLLVTVGTSAVVYPAAELPRIAMRSGATTVEINLDDTPVSPLYQHRLRGTASEMLAAMRR